MNNFLSISEFDFSGKRVRYHGKCQSKFDLSYLIDMCRALLANNPDTSVVVFGISLIKI